MTYCQTHQDNSLQEVREVPFLWPMTAPPQKSKCHLNPSIWRAAVPMAPTQRLDITVKSKLGGIIEDISLGSSRGTQIQIRSCLLIPGDYRWEAANVATQKSSLMTWYQKHQPHPAGWDMSGPVAGGQDEDLEFPRCRRRKLYSGPQTSEPTGEGPEQ